MRRRSGNGKLSVRKTAVTVTPIISIDAPRIFDEENQVRIGRRVDDKPATNARQFSNRSMAGNPSLAMDRALHRLVLRKEPCRCAIAAPTAGIEQPSLHGRSCSRAPPLAATPAESATGKSECAKTERVKRVSRISPNRANWHVFPNWAPCMILRRHRGGQHSNGSRFAASIKS